MSVLNSNHFEMMGQCPAMNNRKPIRLKHVGTRLETFDSLHTAQSLDSGCSKEVCLGSIMGQTGRSSTLPRSPEEVMEHAKDFLNQYFTSSKRLNSASHIARLQQVDQEIKSTGTYQLTNTELIYGAKLAWRNAVRCIGRIQWSKLQVFDCRYVTTTSGMFEALCNHMKYSTNKGNIRSAITVFPQRTDGKHDYRVWNPQLVSYAGYKQPDGTILGDPQNVEFTEVCMNLGWKGPGTKFDILPLVLSANGHDPDYFDVPSDLVMEVNLTHPTYEWFEELGLKWYVLPAVSNMVFDCGGLYFTATPFNGWYMSTEIGCRNLCDPHRLNMLEPVAQKMGLDTRSPISLWKDKAMVECNVAVLHSFQAKGVTIVDHHTASESFMKHLENEVRLRRGCPADWIWIVPPMSGSATPVFHQEMALYTLRPYYEYQDPAWKTHIWKKMRESVSGPKKQNRKFHFKQIARAVKFTSKLFGKALSRRIKATVLYATETGKSEGYAKKLCELLGHAFNAQVFCMADYDIGNIEHEALLLVVTSTFGNGDPPENGEEFAKNLYALKISEMNGTNSDEKRSSFSIPMTSKSFIKVNSQIDIQFNKSLERNDSVRVSLSEPLLEDTFGPLSNVRFAVFALGSSAYPNFCAFGQYVDNLLGELGGERLLKMAQGDEMCGQEQAFRKWAPEAFRLACEAFCLEDTNTYLEATMTLQTATLSQNTVKFIEAKPVNKSIALSKMHNKNVTSSALVQISNLHGEKSERTTLNLVIESNLVYNPGDHVGVFAKNRPDVVDAILRKLKGITDPDEVVELQILKENHTSNGVVKSWNPHEKLPACTAREMFSDFLDITTPPTPNLLQHFATIATDEEDQKRLNILATEPAAYEDWRHWKFPNILEVLEEFPSVHPFAPLLIAQLSLLQPRFYSISSSRSIHPGQIHLTVAVVVYRTEDGDGPVHFGVCSNYLHDLEVGDQINLFVRRAPNFYLPSDSTKPIILVGPGTGIAPFRAFWQQRLAQKRNKIKLGRCWLFFGCRQKELDLYKEEKQMMVKEGVIDRVFLALSRECNIKKTYVQDLAMDEAEEIYRILVVEGGHFYVCGDCTMAEHVYQMLKTIIQKQGNMTEAAVEKLLLRIRGYSGQKKKDRNCMSLTKKELDECRYHEDIFGITLRTAEVHNRSRESARIRMASEP